MVLGRARAVRDKAQLMITLCLHCSSPSFDRDAEHCPVCRRWICRKCLRLHLRTCDGGDGGYWQTAAELEGRLCLSAWCRRSGVVPGRRCACGSKEPRNHYLILIEGYNELTEIQRT